MAKKTLKQFIEVAGHIEPSLIRAVVKQIGGWGSFTESAKDVTNHGAAVGFSGFIYYTDTVAFTKRNKKAIIEFAGQQAREFGNDGVISFIASFNCMNGTSQEEVADGLYNPKSDDQTQVFNALAWYMLEEVARSYTDWLETED